MRIRKAIFPFGVLRSESGTMLPLILILIALMSALAFGVGGLMQDRREEIKRVNERLTAKYVAKQFESLLKRQKVWDQVKSHNSNLACLQAGGCGTSPIEIRVITDANGAVIFDRGESHYGLTQTGERCEGVGSGNCLYRLKVTLEPGSIVKGVVELAGHDQSFNSNNYKFEIQK